MNGKFRLNVRVNIETLDEHGSYRGEHLSVDETMLMDVASFLEAAQVLGRFHELLLVLKEKPVRDELPALDRTDEGGLM